MNLLYHDERGRAFLTVLALRNNDEIAREFVILRTYKPIIASNVFHLSCPRFISLIFTFSHNHQLIIFKIDVINTLSLQKGNAHEIH